MGWAWTGMSIHKLAVPTSRRKKALDLKYEWFFSRHTNDTPVF